MTKTYVPGDSEQARDPAHEREVIVAWHRLQASRYDVFADRATDRDAKLALQGAPTRTVRRRACLRARGEGALGDVTLPEGSLVRGPTSEEAPQLGRRPAPRDQGGGRHTVESRPRCGAW
jgi:hypothetical protein